MINTVEKTFIVHNVPDYNTILLFIKEMGGCILRITTSSSNINESDTIKIYTQGDENKLLFAQFLFNKYRNRKKELEKVINE